MKKALLIGLNYSGTDMELGGCQNDMNALEALMKSCDVDVTKKFSITRNEVLSFFEEAKKLRPIDTLYFCYSGHGTQIASTLESDKMSEALVFWNGGPSYELLYDRELKSLVSELACKVIVYLDSCFSGGMTKSLAGIVLDVTNPIKQKFTIQNPAMQIPDFIKSKEIIISRNRQCFMTACQENETAIDLGGNGAFTAGFLKAWSQNKRTVTTIMKKAISECKRYQKPKFEMINQSSVKLF